MTAMDLPRCDEHDPSDAWRCQLLPYHRGPHAVVFRQQFGGKMMRRWSPTLPVTDNGTNSYGDLSDVPPRWALACPYTEYLE